MVSRIAYFVRMLAIFTIFGQTFLLSGLEKIGPPPEWFQQTFGDSFLGTFPGIPIAWLIIGALEMAVVIILIISLIRLEFMPDRSKDFLKLGLMVAALTFAALAFGQHLVGEFGGAAELFFYFGATMATLLVIDKDHDAAALHQHKG